MNTDEHRERLKEFLFTREPYQSPDLNEALYAISELGLWPDSVSSVSVEQAVMCWQIVQKLMVADFPDELKM